MKNKIKNKKICVIGGGYWGKNHIRTLNSLESLGAIVEKDKNLRQFYKNKYYGISILNSVEDAIQLSDIDGFVVATPPITHYQIAKKIILAKKDVLVEKPLTLNSQDSLKLIQLAKENDVNLMVGHILLFHPAIIKMSQMIKSGEIGELNYLYSNRLNFGKVRSEENVIWSLAPHDLSVFDFFIGETAISLQVNSESYIQEKITDTAILSLSYPNKIKGHIFVSWHHLFKEHRLVVMGSKGMLSFEDSSVNKALKILRGGFKVKNNKPVEFKGNEELVEYPNEQPLEEELKYFINHIGNKKISKSNGEHALDIIKILEKTDKE